MTAAATLTIHASQFPEAVRRDLLKSLRARKINHKFHYDSFKQTQKWLALHQVHAPSRNDPDCRRIYEAGFEAAAAGMKAPHVHVVGLGCGGGQKDTRLLKRLRERGREIFYTPCDVSVAMVLTARRTALAVVPEENCFPFVCDLAGDSPVVFEQPSGTRPPRIITFFGMIPNFEPEQILPRLASLVGRGDFLLFSANLAPGESYAAGVGEILPQYDNPPTRDWLMTFLLDLGVGRRDGDLRFAVETGRFGLKRIVARFHFRRPRRIEVENESFNFNDGDSIRLFFSCRYTPERVKKILAGHGLDVCDRWIARSGEEGVFLCARARRRRVKTPSLSLGRP